MSKSSVFIGWTCDWFGWRWACVFVPAVCMLLMLIMLHTLVISEQNLLPKPLPTYYLSSPSS